ncbi:type II secretion system F family protein [Streptomyces chumphonensis]|uniref:type II secretion system F family protein n=1 Tax=Streptomyces chumphonensis TaxID=1214925 RepID=UPI003D70FB3D
MTGPGGPEAAYTALLCAGAAVWMVGGPDPSLRRVRLLCAGGGPQGAAGLLRRALPSSLRTSETAARLRARAGPHWLCPPAGVGLGFLGESVLPVLAGALAAPLVGRWRRTGERRRAAERREAAVIELCAALAAEVRAGRQPEQALPTVIEIGGAALGGPGADVLAAVRFGGDVPAALRRAAELPGAGGLAGVAACWRVAVDGGAGLADGLDRVAGALRAERDQREELRAQLAGPRATAVTLALLPVFGVLLGTAMGAKPLHFLLHSPAGWALLTGAVLLECAGLAWTRRIVQVAEGVRSARPARSVAGRAPS